MHPNEMLRAVSRTFALSIERLPPILCEAITTAYLLLRVSDCLEDNEQLPAQQKAELLRLWSRVLANKEPVDALTDKIAWLDGSDPEVYVAQHAGQLLEEMRRLPQPIQEILISHVNLTSLGMARWQEHGPEVYNEEELDDYMHQVAGLVGYLLTDLFSWYSPAIRKRKESLLPLSRHFGLALQTVNIIRGLRKDYERGWVFIPRTFYEPLGLTRDGLLEQANTSKVMQVIDQLANKAETHLQYGLTYILNIPRRYHAIRLACMWPLLFAVKTLALSRSNVNVVLTEAKITRDEIKAIMYNTTLFGWSNQWLVNYYHHLRTVPSSPVAAAAVPAQA
jgi:farnesyl-diphosphate farnesyltransferase